MGKIRKYIQDNNIFLKIFSGYIIVSWVIILVLSALMSNLFSSEMKKEIHQSQLQNLNHLSNTVEFRAEYVSYLMLHLKQDEGILPLFSTSKSYDNYYSAINELDKIRMGVKQLQSIYIYNERNNRIFCSGDSLNSHIYSKENFEDKEFINMVKNIDSYSNLTPIFRQITVMDPNGIEHYEYVLTYLTFDRFSSGKISNIIAFNFSIGWIGDALSFIKNGEISSEKIMIIDSNMVIVYSKYNNQLGNIFSINEDLKEQFLKEKSGYIILKDEKNSKIITFAKSDRREYKDWIFISQCDYENILKPIKKVHSILIIIVSSAFIICFIVCLILSDQVYIPVKEMLEKVNFLQLEQQGKIIVERNNFLIKLFTGRYADDMQMISDNFEKYNIQFSISNDIRLILVSVDYANSFIYQYRNELDRIDRIINKILSESFERVFQEAIVIKYQNEIWAVCIPTLQQGEEYENDQAEEKSIIIEIFDSINKELQKEINITVSFSVSDKGHSVRDIPFLFTDAINVHSYHYLYGCNKIIYHENIVQQEHQKFVYPHEIEKILISNLFSGKASEVDKAYEDFLNIIRTFPVGEIKLSFMILAYAIKSASHNTTAEVSNILMDFDQLYRKLQSLETMNEASQMFRNIFNEIIDMLQLFAVERYEVLINKVKEFVSEHYSQSTLCMNEVADYANMSAAYLGRLFKQVTNTTFTEYLTQYRMDVACQLLENTEKTVNEISDEIGFSNSSYFYIVFKKNIGCTPNQYRKKYLENS